MGEKAKRMAVALYQVVDWRKATYLQRIRMRVVCLETYGRYKAVERLNFFRLQPASFVSLALVALLESINRHFVVRSRTSYGIVSDRE